MNRKSHFRREELALRAAIAQRTSPRPPLPQSPPPSAISPTSSDLSVIDDPFKRLPWNVMYSVFSTFELKDRILAAMVCRRWRRLLTDGHCPLSDVSVVNFFEHTVWEDKLSGSVGVGGRVQCVKMDSVDCLDSVLIHLNSPSVVKIWYHRAEFLRTVLERLQSSGVRICSLDIYPYSNYVGVNVVHRFFPKISSITMRPHASEFFFKGLSLPQFPPFECLDSLTIDTFNLDGESQLPTSIRTLDWQCRNDDSLEPFIERLEKLTLLECLTIGQIHFDDCLFLRFIQSVGHWNMSSLHFLYFKMVKFDIERLAKQKQWKIVALNSLRYLHLDLCCGYLPLITDFFLRLTSSALKVLSVTVLTDGKEFWLDSLIEMASRFAQRGIGIQLSIMEPQEGKASRIPLCSELFGSLLTKFEASFVSDHLAIPKILGASQFPTLSEIKLIHCPAADNQLLERISMICPRLTKLSILSCDGCTQQGISHFVENFESRQSKTLRIVWQRDEISLSGSAFITDFYKSILPFEVDGLKIRSIRKQFRSRFGEVVIIWKGDKCLYVRDHDDHERNRILGIILPNSVDSSP